MVWPEPDPSPLFSAPHRLHTPHRALSSPPYSTSSWTPPQPFLDIDGNQRAPGTSGSNRIHEAATPRVCQGSPDIVAQERTRVQGPMRLTVGLMMNNALGSLLWGLLKWVTPRLMSSSDRPSYKISHSFPHAQNGNYGFHCYAPKLGIIALSNTLLAWSSPSQRTLRIQQNHL